MLSALSPDQGADSLRRQAPIARRSRHLLILSAVIFVIAQGLVVLLGVAGMTVANVARAYVAGEAQYSKAQKEAVISLMRYVESGSDADYGVFRAALEAPRGDRAARHALDRRRLIRGPRRRASCAAEIRATTSRG